MEKDEKEITRKDIEETAEKIKTAKEKIIQRIKSPSFWIDNALLIALLATTIYLGIKGHYIDTRIIEVCNGVPIKNSPLA